MKEEARTRRPVSRINTTRESANTVGWGSSEPAGFGQAQDQSVKNKLINLISAIRTLLRSEYGEWC